ncbi:uncharacterized protein LOC115883306 [Sitophilus oryzae]|uniref:Uncharacterized protein LOC115883306 n=1 Tax=Sitophilus oryzae TaxID=7048 RepID=A0A6J2Y2L0_SITOR|nr:uncharacterized protein LOC115883306 [Sitophilus oryzae]
MTDSEDYPKRNLPENDDYVLQPLKFRRMCTGVRKELFKNQGSSQKKKKNANRDSTLHTSPESCKQYLLSTLPRLKVLGQGSSQKKKKNANRDSTLHTSPENCKQYLLSTLPRLKVLCQKTGTCPNSSSKNNKNPLKSPRLPSPRITVSEHNNCNASKVRTTPNLKNDVDFKDSDSPDTLQFVKLEQFCETTKPKESPLSSVCSLLQNNMLLNSTKKNIPNDVQNKDEILKEIKDLLQKDQEQYELTSNRIREMFLIMHKNHEENYKRIFSLIESLDDENEKSAQKENCFAPKRRSLRLKNKSPTKPAGSPVILKAGDLRKSTLTKSLVSKCQKYQIDSPRIKNAMSLYNSTKSSCSALLTPKILKNQASESPKISNWRANMSIKLQQQCLLLQDTPQHK